MSSIDKQLAPFTALVARQEEIIKKQEEVIRELTDFRERIENIVYRGQELDEHGNSKPYRFDHLLGELRAALNNEFEWKQPWRVVK